MTQEHPPHVYTAIAAVMADMTKEGISKASKNTQQGYAFRGIDAVYNALAPKLAAHGLCILPRVTAKEVAERESRNGGVLFYTRLTVEFDLVAAQDGSKHTICTVGEAMDSADKSSNKAMSAAFKYAAFMAFCIPTEGDNDADNTTHEVRAASYTPPAIVIEARKDPIHIEHTQPDPLQVASLKKLRDCEHNTSGKPPMFTQTQAKDGAALAAEYAASRGRVYTWITGKIDTAPALEELDNQGLIDLAYATAGL